jgi:rubrerythrin
VTNAATVCLPFERLLSSVYGVEEDMIRFYRLVIDHAGEGTVRQTFSRLLEEKSGRAESLSRVRGSLRLSDEIVPQTRSDSAQFLTVLAQSAFYDRSGVPVDRFDPDLTWPEVVENALDLERSLLIFYMRFYQVACAEQRPIFSGLIQQSERHITALNGLRDRLHVTVGSTRLRSHRQPAV